MQVKQQCSQEFCWLWNFIWICQYNQTKNRVLNVNWSRRTRIISWKRLFEALTSSNFFCQTKMIFEKPREVFIHNINIYNNLSHFSHSFYGFGESKPYLEGKFSGFQMSVLIIQFKEPFSSNVNEFLETERFFC